MNESVWTYLSTAPCGRLASLSLSHSQPPRGVRAPSSVLRNAKKSRTRRSSMGLCVLWQDKYLIKNTHTELWHYRPTALWLTHTRDHTHRTQHDICCILAHTHTHTHTRARARAPTPNPTLFVSDVRSSRGLRSSLPRAPPPCWEGRPRRRPGGQRRSARLSGRAAAA